MEAIERLQASLSGRYSVIREIGAGGMATVYLARDVKHDRHVALKVLRPELGAVLGVERFLSEIKVTANLQHPHLLPLFDSGEAEGLLFYVMPFVEGESLRTRLERENQLPMDDALRFVLAIASALEYAHKQGVVHRDLKPENILLQHGEPVVSDFGIALAVSKAGGARVTQTGLSLGTPQYMSPEQATGDREIDARSDQYSLAAVLYEMLTGEPPHSGKTAQAIIARVLTEKPSSARVQRDTVAPHVDAALMRALSKLPADRFPSVGAFAEALKNPSYATTEAGAATLSGIVAATTGVRISARPSRFKDPAFVGVAVIAVAAMAWAAFGSPRTGPPAADGAVRFSLTPDTSAVPFFLGTWSVVPSPDGRRVVYTAAVAHRPMLVVRDLDALQGRVLAGTEGASEPMFSPDGKWIAFEASGKIQKLLASGGPPIALGDGGANNGADWATDDLMIFGSEGSLNGLSKMPASGGKLVEFTHPDASKGEVQHLWPVTLADGNTVVFVIWDGKSKAGSHLAMTTIKDGKVTDLGVAGIAPVGVFEGYLVYAQVDGNLMAVPIDVGARKLAGAPLPLLDSIPVCAPCNGDAAVHASRNGTLAYMRGTVLNRLMWADRKGSLQPLGLPLNAHASPRLSPDGSRVAVTITKSVSDVWVYTIASGTLSRLTSGGAANGLPQWSADGRSIYYSADGGAKSGVWRRNSDGSGVAELVAPMPGGSSFTVSPDGKNIVYTVFTSSVDLMQAPTDQSGKPKALLATQANESLPAFSPDGKWIAYISTETGIAEVYVMPFAPGGGRVQVSAGGGSEPVWSANGRAVYYRAGPRMLVATLTPGTMAVAKRDTAFTATFDASNTAANYDVSRDGSRFIVARGDQADQQVIIVSNWLAELRARVGKK